MSVQLQHMRWCHPILIVGVTDKIKRIHNYEVMFVSALVSNLVLHMQSLFDCVARQLKFSSLRPDVYMYSLP